MTGKRHQAPKCGSVIRGPAKVKDARSDYDIRVASPRQVESFPSVVDHFDSAGTVTGKRHQALKCGSDLPRSKTPDDSSGSHRHVDLKVSRLLIILL